MGLLSSVACHVAIVPGASLRARVWVAPARLAATFCRKNGTDRRFGTVRTPQNHVFGVDLPRSVRSHQAKRSCLPLPAPARPYRTVDQCHSGRKTWRQGRERGSFASPALPRHRGAGVRVLATAAESMRFLPRCRASTRSCARVEPMRPPALGVGKVRRRAPGAEAAHGRARGPARRTRGEIDVPAKAAPVPIPDARARSTQLPPFARKVAVICVLVWLNRGEARLAVAFGLVAHR